MTDFLPVDDQLKVILRGAVDIQVEEELRKKLKGQSYQLYAEQKLQTSISLTKP